MKTSVAHEFGKMLAVIMFAHGDELNVLENIFYEVCRLVVEG